MAKARILHGQRYLETTYSEDGSVDRMGARQELADFILNDLPYLDFKTACWFYAENMAEFTYNDLALLGCNDRFFLFAVLLGRSDAMHPWLYDRAREVEDEPDGYLDLWAREHYKSSLITFAGIVQEIMRDPEITVCIFSFRKKIAEAFLVQIMQEFERNELLKYIYSDVLYSEPKKQSRKWSQADGIFVKRKTNPKEATVEVSGLVDGMPTSKHYRLMVYDDVVTDKSVTNADSVKKTTEAWELSDNLGAGDVRKWHIGTRYTFADSYGVIMGRHVMISRLYPATHNGKADGDPVFMSPKRWAEKKKTQQSSLSAQMLQNPIAGKEQMFKPIWFRAWHTRPVGMNVYIMVDPSGGKGKTSDRTAIAVVGIDIAGNKYLLDGFRHRMSMSERWEAIKMLYLKWTKQPGVQVVSVGYEKYGMQTDLEYIEREMADPRCTISFAVKELNWTRENDQSKKARVSRLEPDFKYGQFYLPGLVKETGVEGSSLWSINEEESRIEYTELRGQITKSMKVLQDAGQAYRIPRPIVRLDENRKPYDLTSVLLEEMMFFPFAPHDDLVDALSRIYDMDPVAASINEQLDQLVPKDYEDS